jgi:predicted 3-demethylubiquinone-9 3-methyltransferase (glyoxalase superfamily)
MMIKGPSISTFLWFARNAEAAAEFYTTLFPGSRIAGISRWGDGGPVPKGSAMTVAFELAGHRITAINGGPHYTLTPAVSLVVSCETQDEIDAYWDALIADGGKPSRCGWLIDRFGLSWQVVPAALGELLTGADPAKAARVGQALMTMGKLDLAALRRAHDEDQAMASGVVTR